MKCSVWGIMLVFSVAVVGCIRPASTAPTPTIPTNSTPSQQTSGLPSTTPEATGQGVTDDMSTAVAGGFATQTEMAARDNTQLKPSATLAPEEIGSPKEPTASSEASTATATLEPTTAVGAPCQSPYTVQAGEWVYSIGRKCNIHPNSIIGANGLVYPFSVFPGDELIFPDNAPPFPAGG